jgi:hypothetical protein
MVQIKNQEATREESAKGRLSNDLQGRDNAFFLIVNIYQTA